MDHEGRYVESGLCNGVIIEVLKDHQVWETAHVELNMQLLHGTDVANVHGSFCSFKRGVVTRALETRVSTPMLNSWDDGDHGRRPRGVGQGAPCASTTRKTSSFWTLN